MQLTVRFDLSARVTFILTVGLFFSHSKRHDEINKTCKIYLTDFPKTCPLFCAKS